MGIYIVKPGDSVDRIAEIYRIPAGEIIYANQIERPYPLAIGQALYIPEKREIEQERPFAMINGYAYPYITDWVLEQTLPYLTELSVFSYGFTESGELIPPKQDDLWMIQKAYEFETNPILTLTPFGEDGAFNNYLIHQVVQSEEAVNRLVEELLLITEEKGYGGVDVDFEYILKEDRDAFTAFVATLTEAMNTVGRQVSVALAPKQSGEQVGLLYEGKDYEGLGKAANYAFLMTYEWGYTYHHIR